MIFSNFTIQIPLRYSFMDKWYVSLNCCIHFVCAQLCCISDIYALNCVAYVICMHSVCAKLCCMHFVCATLCCISDMYSISMCSFVLYSWYVCVLYLNEENCFTPYGWLWEDSLFPYFIAHPLLVLTYSVFHFIVWTRLSNFKQLFCKTIRIDKSLTWDKRTTWTSNMRLWGGFNIRHFLQVSVARRTDIRSVCVQLCCIICLQDLCSIILYALCMCSIVLYTWYVCVMYTCSCVCDKYDSPAFLNFRHTFPLTSATIIIHQCM